MEAAEKAKAEAVKTEVAAALAAQKEEHDRLVAEQKRKAAQDKAQAKAAAAEALRLQQAENDRQAAIEEAKK